MAFGNTGSILAPQTSHEFYKLDGNSGWRATVAPYSAAFSIPRVGGFVLKEYDQSTCEAMFLSVSDNQMHMCR